MVCRAGSSTLAEVTALGLPAIVVPYPFAVADHQTGNARALSDAGAALLVKDSVNAAADAMGFTEALRHAFHIHELGHAHWAAANENRYPVGLPPDVPDWRTLGAPTPSRRDTP